MKATKQKLDDYTKEILKPTYHYQLQADFKDIHISHEMEPIELDKALQPRDTEGLNSIRLSPFINFKDACNYELEFLKKVDSSPDKYYNAEYIDISIKRYEKYWLPLVAENSPLQATADETNHDSSVGATRKGSDAKWFNKFAPPTDIHWVWHVHMLAPVSYIEDCKVS